MPMFEITHTVVQTVHAKSAEEAEQMARDALDEADLHSPAVLEDAEITAR